MRDTDGLGQAWGYETRLDGIRIYFEDRASGICYRIKCQIIPDYLSPLSTCAMWAVMRSTLKIVVSMSSVSLSLLKIPLCGAATTILQSNYM